MNAPVPFSWPGAEPVLMLHCSAACGGQWDGLARSLGDGGRVIAPDLHGYGDAGPWCGPGPLSLAVEAERAVAAIPGDDPAAHVVGHSYGGAVALRLAVARHSRMRSLTLMEPVAFHVLRQGNSRDRRLLGAVQRVAGIVIEGVLSGDYHGAMMHFVDYWNGEGAWEALNPETRHRFICLAPKVVLDFHAAMNEDTSLHTYRSLFRFPVRLVRGDRSPEPVRRVAELLTEHIDGAALVTVAGAGHMLPLSHPGAALAVLREQLAVSPTPGRRAA